MKDSKSCQHGMQKDPFTRRCDIPKVKNWIFNKQQSRNGNYIFNHEETDATIDIFKPVSSKYWGVSILGNRRVQHEYLTGGNSKRHSATRDDAMDLAKAYMLLHPEGHRDY